ncbi:helix-turn-helix domain-containing protein [Spongiactinospora sp. TRM90649]|uniref:helix-turn-helix domain-containing protein n=1 Tax=Spongiactinospora sp. TRM90649 TaxID=3031114 RepID=UPI0023F7ED27|nr:helix-turn-helix domain-containing protein [Spongiactinospora sp. TRM90649]MDF5756079.1 GAF domain-containing protein [Spongiactinospora sp. TRM90649]
MRDSRAPAVPAVAARDLDEYASRLRAWHEAAVNGATDGGAGRPDPGDSGAHEGNGTPGRGRAGRRRPNASPPKEEEPRGEVEHRPRGDGPRGVIAASWRRSLNAGIDPETRAAPIVYEHADMTDVRGSHPLNPHLPLLVGTLLQTVRDTGMVMAVADANGRVLWSDGDRRAVAYGESLGLCDGFDWAEAAVGTNGIGTALATGRPVHVYAGEHLVRALQAWSCSGAPIIDPGTGEVVGCVNVSGAPERLHPATVALVHAAARLAESHIALGVGARDDILRARYDERARSSHAAGRGALVAPGGRILAGDLPGRWGPKIGLPASGDTVLLRDGTVGVLEPIGEGYLIHPAERIRSHVLALSFLGADHPSASLDGFPVQLSLRHAEILAVLALNPRGMTADQLSFQLYGDLGNPVTIRAEIHRLRSQLGAAIAAKPYRLACEVEADFIDIQRLLSHRDPVALARAYPGPLLPRSESPAIRRERDELEGQVRAHILRDASAEALWTYAQTPHGHDDPQVLERLTTLLPAHDHRAVAARIRLAADSA